MANDSSILFRPATLDDAEALTEALLRNREHLRPWEPARPADFFTARDQANRLADPSVQRWLLTEGPRVVGTATLTNIALGSFRSANLGYWIDSDYTGRGLATRAAEEICRVARDDYGLHRVEAGTLLVNTASQRVLSKCGFELIGTAPSYLHIAGQWRDHRLYQRILHDGPPNAAA
ncbi:MULTISPECIES: GNAT family N-acetyltransferase [unclassified Streptomyces]|uniref:GNAT family N-acetyltransferase n=1 Tax=unclassified Streptomyces TaxID=2593676 RepID=UPI002E28FBE4|nr:GNAT family protein [Streptomyces sp. NBC_01429]